MPYTPIDPITGKPKATEASTAANQQESALADAQTRRNNMLAQDASGTGGYVLPPSSFSEIAGASSMSGIDLVNEAKKKIAAVTPPPVVPTVTTGATGGTQNNGGTATGATTTGTKETPTPTKTGQYTFDEAYQLFGNDFTGVIQQPDGKYTPDYTALNRLGVKTTPTVTTDNSEFQKIKSQAEADVAKLRGFDAEMANDPTLQRELNNIANSWDARIAEGQKVADSRTAAMTTAGFRLGGRYGGGSAGPMAGIISAEERAGVAMVNDLLAQKNAALSAADTAYREKKWNKYVDLANLSDKKYSEAKAAITKLNEISVAQTQKITDQNNQVQRDTIFAGIIQTDPSLMSDPGKLLYYLNSNGGDFTADEVGKKIKDLTVTEKTVPGAYGAWLAAKKANPSDPNVAKFEDFLNMTDPQAALTLQKTKLDIAKLQKEMSGAGGGALDTVQAADLMAYANDTAATGRLPSPAELKAAGLNVGQVASVAKEIPKPVGALVDRNTGIKAAKLGAEQEKGIIALSEIVRTTLPELRRLYPKLYTGALGSLGGAIVSDQDRTDYNTFRSEFLAKLLVARSGATVTPQEYDRYAALIPDSYSINPISSIDPFRTKRGENILGSLDKSMRNSLNNSLNSSGTSIYGYSTVKVKINGKNVEKTVGDTIDIGGGRTGRVLPDGQISTL